MILRNVTDEDLPIFFEHQRDPEALRMAAFPSRERDAFMTHWRTKVLRPENVNRTIVMGRVVVGTSAVGNRMPSASSAIGLVASIGAKASPLGPSLSFSCSSPARPLHAWVAPHNLASIRVLEKCGFHTILNENHHHPGGVAEVLMRLGST